MKVYEVLLRDYGDYVPQTSSKGLFFTREQAEAKMKAESCSDQFDEFSPDGDGGYSTQGEYNKVLSVREREVL